MFYVFLQRIIYKPLQGTGGVLYPLMRALGPALEIGLGNFGSDRRFV